MNIICKEIRENARRSLDGRWILAALGILLYSIFSVIRYVAPEFASKHTVLLTILSGIYIIFLLFGYTKFLLNIARDKQVEIKDILIEGKRFFKALGMILLVGLYTMAWSILFFIPGIIAMFKYSMTFYIWVDNPDIGINEAINRSCRITKGHKWDIFKLGLSFIGWKVLAALPIIAFMIWHISQDYFFFVEPIYKMSLYTPAMLISFIGSIFLAAYISVSMAKLYDKLIEENSKNNII